LRSLELDFHYVPTSASDASIFPSHVQHLKSLRLIFDFNIDSEPNYVDSVLKSFAKERSLQNLEDLDIFLASPCDGSVLGSVLQSTVNVKSVNLWSDDRDIPDILSANFMPKLEALQVNHPYLLDYFDPPNLMNLSVQSDSHKLSHFKLGSRLIKLDVPGWIVNPKYTQSSLKTFTLKHRHITLYSRISPRFIGRFSFLEEIYLYGNPTVEERELVNDFLVTILRNKGSCPRLHTIKFRAFPLWELLFEVMRQPMTENI
jgi:hypothetical protein